MQSMPVFNHPSCWKSFLGVSSVVICRLNRASPFAFSSLVYYFFLPLTILLSLFWTLSSFPFAISQIRLGIPSRTLPQLKSPKGYLTLHSYYPPVEFTFFYLFLIAAALLIKSWLCSPSSFLWDCCLNTSCLDFICVLWKCRTLHRSLHKFATYL